MLLKYVILFFLVDFFHILPVLETIYKYTCLPKLSMNTKTKNIFDSVSRLLVCLILFQTVAIQWKFNIFFSSMLYRSITLWFKINNLFCFCFGVTPSQLRLTYGSNQGLASSKLLPYLLYNDS